MKFLGGVKLEKPQQKHIQTLFLPPRNPYGVTKLSSSFVSDTKSGRGMRSDEAPSSKVCEGKDAGQSHLTHHHRGG